MHSTGIVLAAPRPGHSWVKCSFRWYATGNTIRKGPLMGELCATVLLAEW